VGEAESVEAEVLESVDKGCLGTAVPALYSDDEVVTGLLFDEP
jgi:hypothetical protein